MQEVRSPSFTRQPRTTHPPRLFADFRTASVIRVARRPSSRFGQAVGRRLAGDRGVGLGDERVKTVVVALRVAAGQCHVGGRLGRERRRVARDPLDAGATADPQGLGLFLVEADRGLGPAQLEPELVLAAR